MKAGELVAKTFEQKSTAIRRILAYLSLGRFLVVQHEPLERTMVHTQANFGAEESVYEKLKPRFIKNIFLFKHMRNLSWKPLLYSASD
jgi:hypothetical protein